MFNYQFDREKAISNLKQEMEKRNIRPKDLAFILGVSEADVSKNLSDKKKSFFEYPKMVYLAEMFNINITELFPVKEVP